ncbi:exosortase/archaeosortase family protein [Litoreibacter halocynthiae]|uniref:Exosortase/archaeosortase family protein n=1 Tax=Litoreibacter halocynthiae TaxID=1242689 RepID=A0A4R7LIL9_9RHOB|nr:exosortase T [Litoreibacter halocynthiae]TDT74211.1 exosortase/archaeosortase family protein [Litoreibacter halocynthiae]
MEQKRDTLLWIGLTVASALLAIEPVRWLFTSWRDPSYQSYGAVYCIVLVGLVGLSLKSSPPGGPAIAGRVFVLFLFAALIRLAGQMLAINILSALALSLDVFALATMLRLDRRKLALSPFWMATFFLFALPLGPILQRVAGFPLQMVSADLACQMMSPFFADLICEGVRLRLNGVDAMVDLPCSGASGLLLMVSLWAFLNILYRPRLLTAFTGGLAVIGLSILGNALRISLLAGGLGQGIDTMAPTLHNSIGLVTLMVAAAPVVLLYRPSAKPVRMLQWRLPAFPKSLHIPMVAVALVAAIAIVNAPKRPVDLSAQVVPARLPMQLLGARAEPIALSETEQRYFTAYGGSAQKVQYGPMGLNIVRTTSPLRHLHSPETCLLGMGYSVQFMGTRYDPLPTSVYEATGPDGRVWTVAVSFISDDGQQTPSVGEAVWSWLGGSSRSWQSVQRVTPKSLPEQDRISFENAALAALDL